MSNLQKEKKCRPHLTTQSPAGIFIELSMKFPGARVPARKKNTFFRVVGALWLLHKLLPGTAKKNQEGDPWGFMPLPPPSADLCGPPPPLCLGNLGRHHRTWPNLDWGVRFVAFLAVLYPQSRPSFVTWKTPHPPLEPGGLGWAEASGPICEPSLRMIDTKVHSPFRKIV